MVAMTISTEDLGLPPGGFLYTKMPATIPKGQWFICCRGEWIVYERLLTAEERQELTRYMAERHGIKLETAG